VTPSIFGTSIELKVGNRGILVNGWTLGLLSVAEG